MAHQVRQPANIYPKQLQFFLCSLFSVFCFLFSFFLFFIDACKFGLPHTARCGTLCDTCNICEFPAKCVCVRAHKYEFS